MDGRTDGRQSVTIRLDSASVIMNKRAVADSKFALMSPSSELNET